MNNCLQIGMTSACAGAEAVGIDRHGPPTEHGQPLVDDDRVDRFLRLLGIGRVERQERQANGVRAGRRQLEAGDIA